MAQSFPMGKPRVPSWLLPPFCLMVAVGAHALWLGVRVAPAAPRPGREAPRLTAVTSTEWKDWTPVMFSLPTSSGFSSALGRLRVEVVPPVASRLELTGTYDFDPSSLFPLREEAAAVVRPPAAEPVMAGRLPVERTPRAAEVRGWRLHAPDRPDLDLWFYRDPRLRNPGRALRIDGEMRFDRYGQLVSLLLEPDGDRDGWVAQLLPDLRQVRVDASAAPVATRFRLEYLPGEDAR